MIKTIPVKQYWRLGNNAAPSASCEPAYDFYGRLYSPRVSTSYLVGSTFDRSPTVFGNHVDALPFWFRETKFSEPEYDKNVRWTNWLPNPWAVPANSCKRMFNAWEGDMDGFLPLTLQDVNINGAVRISEEQKKLCRELSLMKAQASLRKADTSIPMLLKERAQTVEYFRVQSGRILDLVHRRQLKDVKRWKQLKRNSTSNARKFLAKQIANEHLAFVFGLLPLIDELEGLATHVTRSEFKFIKGRGRMRQNVEKRFVSNDPYSDTVKTIIASYSVRTSLRADINFTILANMQKLGFNPLYTLYDFTPLSFITGWFSNFSYWIQSLDPLYSATYRTGSSSIMEICSADSQTYAKSAGSWVRNGKATQSAYSRTMNRVVHATEPKHGSLTLYNNFSFFSVTAAASLFVQRKVKLANKAIGRKPFRYKSSKPITLPPIRYSRSTS